MGTQQLAKSDGRTIAIGPVRSGDVIFVFNKTRLTGGIGSVVTTAGQRVLAALRKQGRVPLLKKIPRHAHVILGIDGGLVIHADGSWVRIEVITDALRDAISGNMKFVAYRKRDMTDELAGAIVAAAIRYHNQKYSFIPFFGAGESKGPAPARASDDHTQFCSRLVAHAYRAAGCSLTELADSKVLPLDLYLICQSEEWKDITADLAPPPLAPSANEIVDKLELPGLEGVTLSEFFKRTDALLDEGARIRMQQHEITYRVVRQMLEIEALLAKLCVAQLAVAKGVRIDPSQLDAKMAADIVSVLEHLELVLGTSRLTDIGQLTPDTFLNSDGATPGESLFAGLPTPLAIRQMQNQRAEVTIYRLLMLAEIGLFTILAHYTGHENFRRFQSVPREHAEKFLAAVAPFLLPAKDLAPFDNGANLFAWVERESDRTVCQTLLKHIVQSLRAVELLLKISTSSQHSAAGNAPDTPRAEKSFSAPAKP